MAALSGANHSKDAEPRDSIVGLIISREWKKRCNAMAPIGPWVTKGSEADILMELVCAAKGRENTVTFGKVLIYKAGMFLFVCTCAPGTCSEAGRTLSGAAFETHAGILPRSEKSWRRHIWVKLIRDRFYNVARVRAFRELFKRAKRLKRESAGPMAIDDNADEDSEEELELPCGFPFLFSDDSDDEENWE